MYNENINTNNKIISTECLLNIFDRMNELKKIYDRKSEFEEKQNNNLDYLNQKRNFNSYISNFAFTVDFYDSTNITIEDYASFITVFQNRLHEIKSIFSNFSINYFDESMKNHGNSINLIIYENSLDLKIGIDNTNKEVTDLFNYIKMLIQNAPEKYDFVIKNKNKICNIYTLSLGNIVGIILSIMLTFIPVVGTLIINDHWMLFPISCLMIGVISGNIIFSGKINELYRNIDMAKIYDGYNPETFESYYKSDKNSYINSSEVIIGKNIDNLKNREEIKELYNKYKNYIYYELLVILIITIIIILI